MANFLIMDPHWIFRAGIRDCLAKLSPENLLYSYESLQAGMKKFRTLIPPVELEIIFFGIDSLNKFWQKDLADLIEWAGKTPVIVIESQAQGETMEYALLGGSAAYLRQDCSKDEFQQAVIQVMNNQIYFPRRYRKGKATNGPLNSKTSPSNQEKIDSLTKRQKEILTYLRSGYKNISIAQSLGVSEHTVRNHMATIFKVLRIQSRTQAALFAKENL